MGGNSKRSVRKAGVHGLPSILLRGKCPLDPGGEEEFLLGLAENEKIQVSILQWGHGDLSLIKGVTATSHKRVKPGTPASRRVLNIKAHEVRQEKRSLHTQ